MSPPVPTLPPPLNNTLVQKIECPVNTNSLCVLSVWNTCYYFFRAATVIRIIRLSYHLVRIRI